MKSENKNIYFSNAKLLVLFGSRTDVHSSFVCRRLLYFNLLSLLLFLF